MNIKLRTTEEELAAENVRLKKKINDLIDFIEQLHGKTESENIKDWPETAEKAPDILFTISQLCREMDEKKLVIPVRKTGKDKDYLKIRETDFDQLLEEGQKTEICDFLAATGILKTQVSGKISWSDSVDGESTKIVLFRKSAYRYLLSVFQRF